METKKSKLPDEPEVDVSKHESIDIDLLTGLLRSGNSRNENTSNSTSNNADEPEVVQHSSYESEEPFY